MIKHTDFQAAINLAQSARRNAAYRRRDAGDPRNPFRAKAGREQEFLEATQSARAYGLILKLLEKEAQRRAWAMTKPARDGICRVTAIFIRAGEIALATLGMAAAFTLLRLPAPAIQAAAIIGVSVALAWAISKK